MCVLIWPTIKVLTDLHSHSPLDTSSSLQGSHTHTRRHPHTHPLNTQHHLLVPKSAGVFPHGASKRQRLRDQRLLRLCSSARLLSTLMQMCARQSGSEGSEGRQACMRCLGNDRPSKHPYLWKPALSLLYSVFFSFIVFSISNSVYCLFFSLVHSLMNGTDEEIH